MSIRLLLLILKAQIENQTIFQPVILSAIAGLVIFKITKKIIHFVLTIIGIVVLYEIFVSVTGYGIPANLL